MSAISCFLMVSVKPALSYNYMYRLNDQQDSKDCEQDGSYKTLDAGGPVSTSAHKSNPFADLYSQVNQKFIPFSLAPIVRTQPLGIKIAVEPSFHVNHPEGVYTKMINKFDYGPVQSLSKAPYEYAHPRIAPFQYMTNFRSPILRHPEIEPARMLPIVPTVETKIAAEPSLQVNPFTAMDNINVKSTVKTRLESAPVQFLRAAEFEPSRYTETAPFVKTNIDYPNRASAKFVAPALSYSYGQPTYTSYQTFGANNWAYNKLPIRPQYDSVEVDAAAAQESCEK